MLRLQAGELRIGDVLDGHALHFDEPAGAADRSMDDDDGLLGEALGVESLNSEVVGGVT